MECVSASNIDPLSASKMDPSVQRLFDGYPNT